MASGQVSPKRGKVVDIPANAPTIGTATDLEQDGKVSVTFTAPSTTTGGPIFSYTAISSPGSITGTGTTSPITVSGLTNSTAYTFTVAGVNGTGAGPYSSASNSATPSVPATSYQSIASATGTGSSGTITFSSIPQTFTSLQIRATNQLSGSVNYGILRPNNDASTSSYTYHSLYADGSTLTADGYNTGMDGGYAAYGTSSSQNANAVGVSIIDIHDYSSTTKYKTIRSMTAYDNNTTGIIFLVSNLWKNQSAITSLTIVAQGGNFSTNTSFALYGIKG